MKKLPFMKILWCTLLIAFVTACAGATAEPTATPTPEPTVAPTAVVPVADGVQRFVVVPGESTASYVVQEELFSGALAKYGIEVGNQEVVGSTQEVEGELQLRLDDPQNALVAGNFQVNLPSLATTRSERDDWIRENALESNQYPLAQFVATAIQGAPTGYTEGEEVTFQLVGDLTVREMTQPVTFDVTATHEGDTITGVATTNMQLTDFGFEPPSFANTLTVSNDFMIRIELTARAE